MIIYKFIGLTIEVLMFGYVICDLFLLMRNIRYQKEWDKEKVMRMRTKPAITRAELCEYYVMFCLRNECKVEF